MKTFRFLLAALLLCMAGCQTTPPPQVSLVNVQFGQATVFETTVRFTLRLANETPGPLTLTGAAHKLYLNGLYVGEGLTGETLELPRLGTATQTVEVHLSNLRLATRLKPLLESQVFDYRLNSTLYTSRGRARTTQEGRLDLRDFQPTPPSDRPQR